MRTSELKNKFSARWDDFKEGIRWHRKRLPSTLFIWPLTSALLITLFLTSTIIGFMIFQAVLFTVFNVAMSSLVIKSGQHSKRMRELQANIDRIEQEVFARIAARNPYIPLPDTGVEVISIKREEDLPDEDF